MTEFFLMGGHALYVWLSYGVGFFIILLIYIQAIIARKSIIQDLAQRQRRDAQAKNRVVEKNTQNSQEQSSSIQGETGGNE